MSHLKNHVVICNWNERATDLVRLLHNKMLDKNDFHPIVVVAEGVEAFPDDDHFEDTFLVPGSPLSRKLLRRANTQDAHTVIILANRNVPNPDDMTLMTALEIRSAIREGPSANGDGRCVRVVAEVLDARKASHFRRTEITGIHEIICEGDVTLRALAQASISPGVIMLLNDLLDYSEETSELYLVPVPVSWINDGFAFDSFSQVFEKVYGSFDDPIFHRPNAILVGLYRPEADGSPTLLANPTRESLKSCGFTTFSPVDRLVVMARNHEAAKALIIPRTGGAHSHSEPSDESALVK